MLGAVRPTIHLQPCAQPCHTGCSPACAVLKSCWCATNNAPLGVAPLPAGEKRLQEHLQFLLTNLSYEHERCVPQGWSSCALGTLLP